MSLYYWELAPNHAQDTGIYKEKSLPMLPTGAVTGSKAGVLPASSGDVERECEVVFLSTVDYFIGFGASSALAITDSATSPFRIKAGVKETYRHIGGRVYFAPLAA
jgi:hypothetical protein